MKVVKRVFELLRLLKHHEKMALRDIASVLQIQPNTAWNLLKTLCDTGITENLGGGMYQLGPEFYRLFSTNTEDDLVGLLKPELETLAKTIKESVVAVTIIGTDLEVICDVTYEREVMVSNRIHFKEDAVYQWATGHLALAWQTPVIRNSIIHGKGLPATEQWQDVDTEEKLFRQLDELRSEEYTQRLNEPAQICSLAVPVMDKDRHFKMSLGVCYPQMRDTDTHRHAIIQNLLLTAEVLGEKLP